MSQLNAPIADPASVDAAIENRFCVRAFKREVLVPRSQIERLLQIASRAPSGTNTQPWKVYVLEGATRDALCDKVCEAHDSLRDHPELETRYRPDYDYYPRHWVDPYLARRRQNGWSLYGLLGIGKGDKDRMHAQHQRNFRLFDAPVGLMFTVDRVMGQGSLVDYGMFLQNVMLAAEARGLATCPQAAWIDYHRIIAEVLGLPPNEQVVCGIALGWPDPASPENTLVSERARLDEFVVRHE